MRYFFLIISLFFVMAFPAGAGIGPAFDPSGWHKTEGDHFVVLYPQSGDADAAQWVLNHAEDYYTDIADDIGYSRYKNFWTWNDRVKIILFDSQQDYVHQTGQPPWSNGFASIYSELFRSRIIVSFKDQPDFLDIILPHEITHLILHDFIGFDRPIPRFFDEGVAQMEEKDDSLHHMDAVAELIKDGRVIPLDDLLNYDLLAHKDDARSVSIFYVESLYIVDFLVKTYGKDNFKELCRHLRDGNGFVDALRAVYYPTIDSMPTLQVKWEDYAKQYS